MKFTTVPCRIFKLLYMTTNLSLFHSIQWLDLVTTPTWSMDILGKAKKPLLFFLSVAITMNVLDPTHDNWLTPPSSRGYAHPIKS